MELLGEERERRSEDVALRRLARDLASGQAIFRVGRKMPTDPICGLPRSVSSPTGSTRYVRNFVPVELESPNHGSTAVLIDGQTLLADSSILNHAPIPLVEGEDSSTDVPLNETRVEWIGDTWQVHWLPGHGRDEITMRLDRPGIGETRSFDFWAHRSEVSRGSSLFNDALYIRRSVPDGVRTIGRGALISIGPGGEVEVSELDQPASEGFALG